jgi:ABC-type nickel/cobalt efflux system permease component RcnA
MRHHMVRRSLSHEQGQVNVIAALLLVAIVVTCVWVWKRLPLETQDYLTDQALPSAAILVVVAIAAWMILRAIRQRRWKQQRRTRLMQAFTKATTREKRLELAFALIELNQYRRTGIEEVLPALQELFTTVLTRALDDKQHQIRGMAASHLGVVGDQSTVRLLLNALEDDHAYVRSCAALGLGRLRAPEAKEKLQKVSVEDWDQTVRSRAREALERIRRSTR